MVFFHENTFHNICTLVDHKGTLRWTPQSESPRQQRISLLEGSKSKEDIADCGLRAARRKGGFTVLLVDGWFSVNVDPLICGNEKQRCVITGATSEMGKTDQPKGTPN